MSQTRLTVLMPCYDAAQTIALTMYSVLRQSFPDYEFLIVDDGSTDSTGDVVTSIHDERIRYVRRPHEGLTSALNAGLAMAQGDWIARIDADDIALPQRLERQMMFAESSRADVIGSWYAMFHSNRIQHVIRTATSHDAIRERLRLQNDIVHPGVLFRRSVVQNVGGYQGGVFEDYDLWLRLYDHARFAAVPEVLTVVRYSPDSYSRQDASLKYLLVGKILERHSAVIDREKPIDHGLLGWRCFFFGNPRHARIHWLRMGVKVVFSPRIMVAFLISFLPENIRTLVKEFRLRHRLEYLVMFHSFASRAARKGLDDVVSEFRVQQTRKDP